jgi:hypothetical protein
LPPPDGCRPRPSPTAARTLSRGGSGTQRRRRWRQEEERDVAAVANSIMPRCSQSAAAARAPRCRRCRRGHPPEPEPGTRDSDLDDPDKRSAGRSETPYHGRPGDLTDVLDTGPVPGRDGRSLSSNFDLKLAAQCPGPGTGRQPEGMARSLGTQIIDAGRARARQSDCGPGLLTPAAAVLARRHSLTRSLSHGRPGPEPDLPVPQSRVPVSRRIRVGWHWYQADAPTDSGLTSKRPADLKPGPGRSNSPGSPGGCRARAGGCQCLRCGRGGRG